MGWAGVALGVIAFYLALPPLLVRSIVPSLVLAAIAARARRRRGARRARSASAGARSWPASAGALGAYGAVKSGVTNLERVVVWSALLAATLRYATPLTFAALGGVISERSGVVNIGLEGMMLIGRVLRRLGRRRHRLAGSAASSSGSRPARVIGLVHAVFAVTLRADQIVSGTAINFLALGITGFLFVNIYGDQGTPDDLPEVPDVHLPIGWIPFFGEALGELNLLVWVGLILRRAAVDLPVPHAARPAPALGGREPAGRRHRRHLRRSACATCAVIASGVLAALGGVFLSIGFVHSFSQNMTRRQRLHRPRGGDLRQVAARRRARRGAAVRLLQRARAAAAGVLADAPRRCSRRCRTC